MNIALLLIGIAASQDLQQSQRAVRDALVCFCELTMRTRGFDVDLPVNVCAQPLCSQVAASPESFGCFQIAVQVIGGLETCILSNAPFCYTWLPDVTDLQKTAVTLQHLAECFKPPSMVGEELSLE